MYQNLWVTTNENRKRYNHDIQVVVILNLLKTHGKRCFLVIFEAQIYKMG